MVLLLMLNGIGCAFKSRRGFSAPLRWFSSGDEPRRGREQSQRHGAIICYGGAMGLDRRQFFRRLVPGDKDSPRRLARYKDLEMYARMQLLPYDFELTPDQEKQLIEAIHGEMAKTSNDDLFSNVIRGRIEEIVEKTIEPWRRQTDLQARARQLQEVKRAAPDYVGNFLELHRDQPVVEKLKEAYRTDDLAALEKLLRQQMELWIAETNERLLLQYDVVSVRDLVFAQLRSWC
jgi:hypothetical protein